MSDKRKLQHESIIGLINYSVLCAKTCDVLKTHDDTLTQSEETCLRKMILFFKRIISLAAKNIIISSLSHKCLYTNF